MVGKVYIVGAGPGDPELLTIKALKAIEEADVILYDRLVGDEIVDMLKKIGKELIYVGKKFGERGADRQKEINELLKKLAEEGKVVVRLKGGDPFIFGRGGEEAQKLAESDIPFEVVPGITSAVAVSAYSGIPLTHRDFVSQATLLTGHPDSRIQWENTGPDSGTLVIYMGLANLPHITETLIKGGWPNDTPVALISRGSYGDQKVLVSSLNCIVEEAKKKSFTTTPALIIVGQVVKLREKIKWFEKKPLFGHRILITGSKKQAFQLAKKLEELGAVTIMLPTIKITPPDSWEELDWALDNLHHYHYLIFPSINSVKYFFHRFSERKKDIRELRNICLGAIGENTINELSRRLLRIDLPSPQAGIEDFFKMLQIKGVKGKRILIPGCKESKGQISDFIKKIGNEVVVVDTYRITDEKIDAQKLRKALISPEIDLVIFTSPASVRNFHSLTKGEPWEKIARKLKIATVGSLTAKEAINAGLKPTIIPKRFTISCLISEIINKFAKITERSEESESLSQHLISP